METEFRKTFNINLLYLVPPPRPPQRFPLLPFATVNPSLPKVTLKVFSSVTLTVYFEVLFVVPFELDSLLWRMTVYSRVTLTVFSRIKLTLSRDGILGHEFDKRLESFARCYSQSFYWRILQKTILFCGFKTSYKKILETRKL
jgi:hypothetical protein